MNSQAIANKRIEYGISRRIPDDEVWNAIQDDDRIEVLSRLAKWGDISSRELNNPNPLQVRVGDVVKIKLAASKVFVASVLEVTERFQFSVMSTHKFMLRTKDLIRFRPHCLESDLSMLEDCFITADDDNVCDVSYVIEVIDRTPNPFPKDRYVVRNLYCLSSYYCEYDQNYDDCHGPVCFTSAIRLAHSIVCNRPSLDLPYGISNVRLMDQWSKSGYPGLGVPYKRITRDFPAKGIRKKAFRKWLLRALPKVAKTKAEAIQDAYRDALEEDKDMSFL